MSPKSAAETVARKFFLQGRVQGVGCRAQIYSVVTSNFRDLSGSVRNLPDGQVEVVLKGDKSRVGEMEAVLRTRLQPPVRVTEVLSEDVDPDSVESGFVVTG